MSIIEILLLAAALAMDAFAVAICKGLAMKRVTVKGCTAVGLWFGGFQALMPFIGFLVGAAFASYIESVDHWVTFILLGLIGANMIRESLGKDEDDVDASLGVKAMFPMAVATSIDALAAGVTFAEFELGMAVFACAAIGVFTFLTSAFGVKLGNVFGIKYKSKAEFVGGVVLIALGLKTLLEGLGVFGA